MQHKQKHVLATTKRKHMRTQRRSRSRSNGACAAADSAAQSSPSLTSHSKSRTRAELRSQYHLPRNPFPLREHRAQALVPLNNIPQRSFQRRDIQITPQPNRQRDRVVRSPALKPLQKPQPTLRIRQRHFRRTRNRTQPRTRLPPRSTGRKRQNRGASNRLRIDSSTSRLARIRLIRRVASSECPPSAKKSSSIPTPATPNTSANSEHRTSSCGVRGNRPPPRYAGAGSAPRSNFPFAVSGRRSNSTSAAGTM